MKEVTIRHRLPDGTFEPLQLAVPEAVREALAYLQEQIDQIVIALEEIGVEV